MKKNHSVKIAIGVICVCLAVLLGVGISQMVFRMTYKESIETYTRNFMEQNREKSEKEKYSSDKTVGSYEKQWMKVMDQMMEQMQMDGLNLMTTDMEESRQISEHFKEIAKENDYEITEYPDSNEVFFNDKTTNGFVVVEDMNDNNTYKSRSVKWFSGYNKVLLNDAFYPAGISAKAGETQDEVFESMGITKDMINYLKKNQGYISFDQDGVNYYFNVYSEEKMKNIDIYMAKGDSTISLDFDDGKLDVLCVWYFN